MIGDLVCTDRVLWDEIIAAIGQGAPPPATDTLDHRGRLILAGLVDGHMHTASAIGWPGIEGAPRSAAAGGVTTCFDMPYDVPHPVTDACKLADKIGGVERTAHVDMALHGTILKTGGVGASLELVADGISAFKLSTYVYDAVRFLRLDHPTMVEASAAITRTDLPVVVHVEDREHVERLTAEARGPADRGDNASPHPPATGRDDGEFRDFRDRPADRRAFTHRAPITGAWLRAGRDVSRHRHAGQRRGLHPVAVHDRGRSGAARRRRRQMQSAVPHGGRGAADVDSPDRDKISCVPTDHSLWQLARKTLPDIFACGVGLVGMRSFAPLMFTPVDEHGLSPMLMSRQCTER
jgi:allantoinase